MIEDRGIVYLVGAGPGDPGLLTRRGADVLAQADVVVYDHLASASLLELASRQAIFICAGKSSGHCTLRQEEINEILLEHAKAGRIVVRLKGGDPLVFGRGAEEAEFLSRHQARFEIVPGVTAAVGVTAYAGIPLTHRAFSSAVAFVTGHGEQEASMGPEVEGVLQASRAPRLDWRALAHFPGTLVVYMGVTRLEAICRTLIRQGKAGATPAAVIENGSLPAQRVFEGSLETIADLAHSAGLHPPALLVVGSVVRCRDALRWYEALPLFGQRILITRPLEEGRRSAASLESMGAEVLLAPSVEILPLTDHGPLDAAIARLAEYQWLVFTSSNGVRFFLDRLEKQGRDLRALGHLKLAAIGPGTAQTLGQFRLRADLVPGEYHSEGLAKALAAHASGCKILLARADRGRTVVKDELDHVAEVDQVAVYRNVDASSLPDEVLKRLGAGTVDWITLTSSAITARLHALLPEDVHDRIGHGIKLASISPITSQAAAELGWKVDVEAPTATWEALIHAIAGASSPSRGR
ncbi:MAG: uroporphyrinogen-III C-methyltransferase [Isosphaeraceae bacterium]